MSRLDDALERTAIDDHGECVAFEAGWRAAVESDEVSTQEQLDVLPAGTMVFFMGYYDGYWATVAVKGGDGNWYDAYDPMEDPPVQVKPFIPCKIVFRPEEDA